MVPVALGNGEVGITRSASKVEVMTPPISARPSGARLRALASAERPRQNRQSPIAVVKLGDRGRRAADNGERVDAPGPEHADAAGNERAANRRVLSSVESARSNEVPTSGDE